ncbi:MAG: aryldialkylphosphatase [Spirochaetales bacterium]|nr:aryldialkylphosphatase [Spirochaetales bacterium]
MHIITVRGPISPKEMGLTLPHEHILVDFVGAEETGTHRYVDDEVKLVMRPYLEDIKLRGVQTLIECTPMFLARDVQLFRDLSQETDLHIITNTGQYKEPFLPKRTFEITAEELAADWIRESEEGIDGTDIRPGFIKTAVANDTLAPTQIKVIKAAAITSKQTGLAIATHTGVAAAAFEIVDILYRTGVGPEKWIFVHAQNEEDPHKLVELAKRGVWISLDGLGPQSQDKHYDSFAVLLEAGLEHKVMLSHDAGWYHVGEPNGGTVRPFTFLFDDFIPFMRKKGVAENTIELMTRKNPSIAFGVG